MAKEYLSRYGKNFTTFHNPINIEFWKKYQKTNYELSINPTILYAGRIGLGIDDSLKLIADAIAVVNETLEISINFALQTPEKPVWIKNYKNILHNSFVDYDDLPKVFSESDLLVLAYDFSEESISFIRYSMPTKASEYMVSGTPIIIFAPEVTAIANYAQTYHWAKVITENNIGYLSAAITELIQSENTRKKLSRNAIKIAEKNHNSIDVTNQFKELIYSLVSSSNNN
jgi:glycosyltransferase involved in cell wall biosynthesis